MILRDEKNYNVDWLHQNINILLMSVCHRSNLVAAIKFPLGIPTTLSQN